MSLSLNVMAFPNFLRKRGSFDIDFCLGLNITRICTLKLKTIDNIFQIRPRVISFEEQVSQIRQHLAQVYERQQEWREAARVLSGIPLETGQK